jgi:hypothetical protein
MAQIDATSAEELSRKIVANHALHMVRSGSSRTGAITPACSAAPVREQNIAIWPRLSHEGSQERRALMRSAIAQSFAFDNEIFLRVMCGKITCEQGKYFTVRCFPYADVNEYRPIEEVGTSGAKATGCTELKASR